MMFTNENLNLIWVLAKTDFVMRYQGSFLGYFWTLLKPLLMFSVLYIVFSVFGAFSVPYYQIHLFIGIIFWNFFVESTMAGLFALLSKAEIIRKIYLPNIVIVISSTVNALMTFLLNLLVFFIIYYFLGPGLNWHILFLPIYIIIIYLFIVAISLLLSVLQVKFRDVSQIWAVLLQAGFFLAPVIYPISLIPEKYLFYFFLNPMVPIIHYSRMLFLQDELPSLKGTLALSVGVLLILTVSFLLFKKLSKNIVETL